MKRKELIKLTRDIPDELLRQQVESEGLSVNDYFLVNGQEDYLVCFWGRNGSQYAVADDDDVNNFAIAQYLLRQGVPVYQSGNEVPNRRPLSPEPAPGAA